MRIAIICEHDLVWAFATWKRSIPLLQDAGHVVAGLWTCPTNLGGLPESKVTSWYLRTFGLMNFIMLGLFAILVRTVQVTSGVYSFSRLAEKSGVPYKECDSPNDPEFSAWLKHNKIDVLVIMVDHILDESVLAIPVVGTINKHAALLPANRGLFPYLWARLLETPQGISFHRVSKEIDAGDLLLQVEIKGSVTDSMIAFYIEVFKSYPRLLIEAITNLMNNKSVKPLHTLDGSYHSLPTREDMKKFYRGGGKIIRWRDVLASVRL